LQTRIIGKNTSPHLSKIFSFPRILIISTKFAFYALSFVSDNAKKPTKCHGASINIMSIHAHYAFALGKTDVGLWLYVPALFLGLQELLPHFGP
jgi:hypothetical protein